MRESAHTHGAIASVRHGSRHEYLFVLELEAAKLASTGTFMSAGRCQLFAPADAGSATGEIHPAAAQIQIHTEERARERQFVLCVFFT
jgi:hypothetical protein